MYYYNSWARWESQGNPDATHGYLQENSFVFFRTARGNNWGVEEITMIVEKDGKIFHDEHDISVKISNDNTKGEKRATVTLRSDADPMEAVKLADKLYKEILGSWN